MLIPFAAAEISLTQPAGLYNVGDEYEGVASISAVTTKNDFFAVNLVCEGQQQVLYYMPQILPAGEMKEIELDIKFDPFLIGGLSGNCYLQSRYGGEAVNTPMFEISKEVILTLDSGEFSIDPGESMYISGTAVKKNGEPLNGVVRVEIPDKPVKASGFVTDGAFNLTVILPGNLAPEIYSLKASAFEQDSQGTVTNEGFASRDIQVNQIIVREDLALNAENLSLGEEFIYTPLLFDQVDAQVVKEVGVTLYSPDRAAFLEQLISSGQPQALNITSNITPGYWTIVQEYNGLKVQRSFQIVEVQRVGFSLSNTSVTVTNLGNVPYNRQAEVVVGDSPQLIDVSLKIGESRKYSLAAPQGVYEINVRNDGTYQNLGSTFLTGRAIEVREGDSGDSGGFGFNWPIIIWPVAVVILLGVGVYYYRRVSKKKYVGTSPSVQLVRMKTSESAKSTGVFDNGQKQLCSVLALKIKNLSEINDSTSNALESIESALSRLRGAGCKVFPDSNSWLAVFSPSITKEKDNSLRAIKAAQQLENQLKEHNRKFSQKIKFGLGVNTGELIVELGSGGFKFTSSGSTVLSAKRAAEVSDGETMLAEDIRKRTLGTVKTEKASAYGWKVQRIVERNNSEFINRFMQRNS